MNNVQYTLMLLDIDNPAFPRFLPQRCIKIHLILDEVLHISLFQIWLIPKITASRSANSKENWRSSEKLTHPLWNLHPEIEATGVSFWAKNFLWVPRTNRIFFYDLYIWQTLIGRERFKILEFCRLRTVTSKSRKFFKRPELSEKLSKYFLTKIRAFALGG